MFVNLCWKTKEDAVEGKVHSLQGVTVKEAMEHYKKIEAVAIKAYLNRFDGWHWITYKRLKG